MSEEKRFRKRFMNAVKEVFGKKEVQLGITAAAAAVAGFFAGRTYERRKKKKEETGG